MFQLAVYAALLAAGATADVLDVLDVGEDTGEIMVFTPRSTGFNSLTELNGNLDDLECLMKMTLNKNEESETLCDETDLSNRIGFNSLKLNDPIVVSYFVREVYSNDDLFEMKQSYQTQNYSFVEILGMSLEQGSQFYHRLNKVIQKPKYRQNANNFNLFKRGFKSLTKMVIMEVDTVSNAMSLSHEVSEYIKVQRPQSTIVSVLAPAKAELDEFSIQRHLQSISYNYSQCENSEYGNYCIEYYCNRSSWDYQAYSDACIDQYDLLGLALLVFLFLPFCCIGCCCIDGIQTPLRFPSRVLPVGKEF